MTVKRRRRGPRKAAHERKDCLVQARVPRELQSALQAEAQRRRLSVSHLVRSVLEDTVELVDNVCTEVDNLVADSIDLARQVKRDAGAIASNAARCYDSASEGEAEGEADAGTARDAAGPEGSAAEPAEPDPLAHVLAWNPVVLNRTAACARCQVALHRGGPAHLGLTQDPSAAPTWLCDDCLASL